MQPLRLAIAAEFDLAEKLLDALAACEWRPAALSAVELVPFGEEQALRFDQKYVEQRALDEANWGDFDVVLFAGNAAHAPLIADALQAGCYVIDLYGVCALLSDVPVIVPSVNDDAIAEASTRRLVTLANPQISQLALTLNAFRTQAVQNVFVTSFLPAAYFDNDKVRALAGQTARLLNGINLDEGVAPVAFDIAPVNVNTANKGDHFSSQIAFQLAKVLPDWNLNLQLHAAQTPVFYAMAQLISVQSDYALNLEDAKAQWAAQHWLNYHETGTMTPVQSAEAEETGVQLSQVSQPSENEAQWWAVCDSQQFSLATLGIALLERVAAFEGFA